MTCIEEMTYTFLKTSLPVNGFARRSTIQYCSNTVHPKSAFQSLSRFETYHDFEQRPQAKSLKVYIVFNSLLGEDVIPLGTFDTRSHQSVLTNQKLNIIAYVIFGYDARLVTR